MNTSLFFLKDNFFSRFRIKIKSFAAMFSVFKSLSDSNLVSDTGEQHAGYEYDNEGCFRFLTNAAVRFFGFKAAIFTSYDNGKEYVLSDYGLNEEVKEVLFQSCVQLSQETSESISFLTAPISNKLKDLKLEFIDDDRGFFVCQLKLKDKQGQYFGNLFLLDHASRELSAPEKQDLALMADQALRLLREQTTSYNLNVLNYRLEANIELLKKIQQSNKIGYWCLEIASGKTEWSDIIYDIYEVDRDFIPNKEIGLSFYHPEHAEELKVAIDQCIMMDKPFDIQCLLITARDNLKWVRVSGFKSKKIIYGSFQDISKIKKNELKFEAIFNTSASLIWFLDSAGLVLNFNATASEIMKVDAGEILGKHLWECPCLANLNTREVKDMLAKALNGQEVNCELEITTEDNQLFLVIFSLRPILNQSKAIAYVLAEVRPIKELAEKTKRYEAIIQGANVGTWEWNIQTGEVLINNNWAKIIGYELEELIPMSIEKWRSLIHPEDLPFVERELVGVNWKSNNFFAIQIRIKHKLGHWVWVVDSGKVLDWSLNGDAQKMYGIHQDISASMESKEELKRLLQTTQLQNERQNQFTSILSHNLKSHGAAIIGLSELLMHDFPELAENQMFQLLLKGANDLNDTIDDVNEILKIKKDDDLYKHVSIAQLIEKILSSFQFHIQNANLEVHNNIDKAIKIWTIEPYLSSVIQNLITNAIKFKREDNGAFLKITYQKDVGCHVLLFEDNGLGINLEKHGKDIFGLYKTFHGFEDSKGLGLYMSKQHVEILGGTLSVSSAEKIGSTFKITLPV